MKPNFETTQNQREQLLKEGFVLLAEALPPELLSRWREISFQMEQDALKAHKRSQQHNGACVVEGSDGPSLLRYDDILRIDSDATLDLLACPAMLAIAREMCGRGSVPLQADILYKQSNPDSVVLWHQGATHPRGYPYLNIGIYLDDADLDDGCLLYVPETQHELQDICQLSKDHGWNIPGTVPQPAKAGDILVQDMMILHGSIPKSSAGVRRTIYVELRPAMGIAESKVQSEHWLELRKRWMGLVLQNALDADWIEEWRKDYPSDLKSQGEEIEAILANHEPPIPSVYCHFPVEREGYPIPERIEADT